ncbi:hypothetical protein E3U43_004015, partial [Larimichthys crocea]
EAVTLPNRRHPASPALHPALPPYPLSRLGLCAAGGGVEHCDRRLCEVVFRSGAASPRGRRALPAARGALCPPLPVTAHQSPCRRRRCSASARSHVPPSHQQHGQQATGGGVRGRGFTSTTSRRRSTGTLHTS